MPRKYNVIAVTAGMGLLWWTTAVLAMLRLAHRVALPWWFVTAPIWLPAASLLITAGKGQEEDDDDI